MHRFCNGITKDLFAVRENGLVIVEYKRRQALSLIFAAGVFIAFLFVIGFEDLLGYLSQVNVYLYLLAAFVVLLGPFFRGLVWYRLFETGRITTSVWQITTIYFASQGIKSVLPIGQLAIQPFIAYSISRKSYFNTERVFAIISVGDTMNLIPFYTVGIAGFAFLLFEEAAAQNLWVYLFSLIGSAIVMAFLAFLIWQYERLFLWVIQKSAIPVRVVGEAFESDRILAVVSVEAIEERFTTFYSWMEELFNNKRDVLILFTISHLGVLATVAGLMLVGSSLGAGFGFSTACVIISLSRFGTAVPSPGGVGGVEAVMIGVGLALTPYSFGVLTTITVLYRILTYWLVMGIGLSVSSKLTQEFESPEEEEFL